VSVRYRCVSACIVPGVSLCECIVPGLSVCVLCKVPGVSVS